MPLRAEVYDQVQAGSMTLIEGTGNLHTEGVRTQEPLIPACVSLVTRTGHVAFEGLIRNDLLDGDMSTRAMRDDCVDPAGSAVQGPSRHTYDLKNASIGGKKGRLVIEMEGFFTGDAHTPPGSRTQYHLKIRGVGGDFKDAVGEGTAVGLATGFPNVEATTSTTYHVRIWIRNRKS